MKALLSVADKRGVLEFARRLHQAGADLVSTGGTWDLLARQGGLPVQKVSDLTGFPEVLEGRVKTLHPAVFGGILARRDRPDHAAQLAQHGISPIDIVAVNLYPFEATLAKAGVTEEDLLEQIDIGGVALLRAAAKNHPFVTVVCDPADYEWVAAQVGQGGPSPAERRRLAAKAFQHTAFYDSLIADWLRGEEPFPGELTLAYRRVMDLRYGENPHQKGALYAQVPSSGGVVGALHLHGKGLSFNNLLDADAAWEVVQAFPEPTVAIIKHTNPCGLASHPDLAEAYRRAYAGDPVSAYGGIGAFNRTVTREAAEALRPVFYEVVVAPGYEPAALEVLKKKRDLRVLQVPGLTPPIPWDFRLVSGGLLLQTPDALAEDPWVWKTVTRRGPTPQEREDLAFAWRAVKFVKSNAIVLAKGKQMVGMGAGQPNRVTSVRLALQVAGERARGSILASDAFFPFPDSIDLAGQAGVMAVVQPGGSIRDGEVIAAADRYGMAMVFTGVRHFRH